jgi:hypothetical protein
MEGKFLDENPDTEDPAATATACAKIRAYHTYIRTTYKVMGLLMWGDLSDERSGL